MSRQYFMPWLVVLLTASCGQTTSPDAQGGVDVQFQIDVQKQLDAPKPSDGVDDQGAVGTDKDGEGEDEGEGTDAKTSEIGGSGCEFPDEPIAGEPGATCNVDGDCDSNICVTTKKGKICTKFCTDCCPEDMACLAYGKVAGTFACQALGLDLCRPCVKDSECAGNGAGALCVSYGDVGSFCGAACATTTDCAAGYSCAQSKGQSGTAKQCVLTTGTCDCSASAIASGAFTLCHVTNGFGACTAVRKCTAQTLAPCAAATPAAEVCGDGQDNDCNGVVDDANTPGCVNYFSDADKDGDGKTGSTSQCLCAPVDTYTATTATDCDDKNAAVHGSALEVCDGFDNDCDGLTDEGCDSDGDGYCNSKLPMVGQPAVCPKGGGDCDDSDASVHPDQQDTCGNLKDDDCDGFTDSGSNVSACVPFFEDDDGDGYGVGLPVCECAAKNGFTATKGGDCNDDDAQAHPGASEACNGVDDNCNGATDEAGATGCTPLFTDLDGDGYGVGAGVCLCAADKNHSATKTGDCDDAAVAISPAATEVCNGKDDNCDGVTDESGATGCTTYFADSDGDGFGDASNAKCLCGAAPPGTTTAAGDCNDASAAAYPGAPEVCDGIDNDCDGKTDGAGSTNCQNFFADSDDDGYGVAGQVACLCAPNAAFSAAKSGDCNDDEAAIHPGAEEVCDGIDNNCAGGTDEEDATGCTVYNRDHDGDGYGAFKDTKCLCAKAGEYTATTSTDCNDSDKAIHPKALEICDGLDNDCDGVVDPAGSDGCNNWFVDSDGDGFGTYAAPSKCLCEGAAGYASMGGDCDDSDATVNLDAVEVCNGKDDNCDGSIDPVNSGQCTVFYSDIDGDGYGMSNLSQCACKAQDSFTALVGGDCKDTDKAINPGVTEICNSVDDNCNGQTDEGLSKAWYTDADKDGYGTGGAQFACAASGLYTANQSGDCDDTKATTYPGAPELCNGVDDNCNGQTDEGGSSKYYLDSDGDGWGTGGGQILCGTTGGFTATQGGDCDDSNAAIHPNATEICNGKDDNCNGQTDEGLPTGQYYKDLDGDGYGAGAPTNACSGVGFVALAGDCNDANAAVHPGATEVCDNADNDCNGVVDDGLPTSTYYTDSDKDGYGVGAGVAACGPFGVNTATKITDCDDSKASVNPGATEICGNSIDDNCNGQTDEGCVACTPTVIAALDTNANLQNVGATPHTATTNQFWIDNWILAGKYALTFEKSPYSANPGYAATVAGGEAAWFDVTIPQGAVFITLAVNLQNWGTSGPDAGLYTTVSLDGVAQQVGPFATYHSGADQVKWTIPASSWGKTVQVKMNVVAPTTSKNSNGGIAFHDLQVLCN